MIDQLGILDIVLILQSNTPILATHAETFLDPPLAMDPMNTRSAIMYIYRIVTCNVISTSPLSHHVLKRGEGGHTNSSAAVG
jgi:hypothetical protein